MTGDLSANEKRLLAALAPVKEAGASLLAERLGATEEAVVQHAHLCSDRGLCRLERRVDRRYELTPEGQMYQQEGLPERQLYDSFGISIGIRELQKHPLAKIGIGWLRKKGWVAIRDGTVEKTGEALPGEDELVLHDPSRGGPGMSDLVRRGLAVEQESVSYHIAITPAGEMLVAGGLDQRDEIGTLTRDDIVNGTWREKKLRRYNIATPPKKVYPGKVHPYRRLIDEMRSILLSMGFTEIHGGIAQSAFWNFDALFQPQDHPAREMQDTFYLQERMSLPGGYERVQDMHERGGKTSSTGWGGTWNPSKAEQCVLRTHTTSLSIQHLKEHPRPPVKAFCIGRVYRREAIDPTHTPEFEQLEGIVMDEGVTFRHLLGYLREFYGAMGFDEVRFRPGYFPYTEPSVEPEVYVDGLGWVELGGAGVFRQEVTSPWGLTCPVLAWGLGVSRVAMLKLGLKDLRVLYRSDVEWIRSTPVNRKGAGKSE
jgi:phenylalanyl-tRNA synthetase alpha chain